MGKKEDIEEKLRTSSLGLEESLKFLTKAEGQRLLNKVAPNLEYISRVQDSAHAKLRKSQRLVTDIQVLSMLRSGTISERQQDPVTGEQKFVIKKAGFEIVFKFLVYNDKISIKIITAI